MDLGRVEIDFLKVLQLKRLVPVKGAALFTPDVNFRRNDVFKIISSVSVGVSTSGSVGLNHEERRYDVTAPFLKSPLVIEVVAGQTLEVPGGVR